MNRLGVHLNRFLSNNIKRKVGELVYGAIFRNSCPSSLTKGWKFFGGLEGEWDNARGRGAMT